MRLKSSRVQRSAGLLAAAVVSANALVAFGTAGSAHAAEVCGGADKWTSWAVSQSTVFETTSGAAYNCSNVYAAYIRSTADYVRAQCRDTGGAWHWSSQGWKWVTTTNSGWDKVVNNVVNDVAIRGQGQNYAQNVRYTY